MRQLSDGVAGIGRGPGIDIDMAGAGLLYEAVFDESTDHLGDDVQRIGDYIVDAPLGRGGGGNVFRGLRIGSDHQVTLKLLRTPLLEPQATQRAWRELEVLEQLECASVPRLQDHGVHDERLYLVYDHIEGRPLDVYCQEERLDLRARVRLLARVARSVNDLHERGFLHRDIKPANVLIDDEGRPFVIDLGLAMLADVTQTQDITGEGQIVGTRAFMSPEQARAERAAFSTRSDVYGLGATAWKILIDRTPHATSAAPRIRSVAPDLPRPLAVVLDRAVAPKSSDRLASALELAEELERWLNNEPLRSMSPSWWRSIGLSIRRRPRRWAIGAAAAIVVIGLTTATATVQAAHVRERLDLLEELEGKQAHIDQFMASIEFASTAAIDRMKASDYQQAWGLMKMLEDYARAEHDVEDPHVTFDEVDAHRDEMTRGALRTIHDMPDLEYGPADYAHAAMRALFEGDWDDNCARALDELIADHDLVGQRR